MNHYESLGTVYAYYICIWSLDLHFLAYMLLSMRLFGIFNTGLYFEDYLCEKAYKPGHAYCLLWRKRTGGFTETAFHASVALLSKACINGVRRPGACIRASLAATVCTRCCAVNCRALSFSAQIPNFAMSQLHELEIRTIPTSQKCYNLPCTICIFF